MPQWDQRQFEDRAAKIAHEFHAGRGDLHALTTKAARDEGLTAEQIRRLGRAVNVKAFEQKFAALKGAADRIVEFPTVDPETVIDGLDVAAREAPTKTAEARYPDLTDELRTARGWRELYAPEATTKTAAEVSATLRQIVDAGPRPEHLLGRWQKAAEDLGRQRAGAVMAWEDAMTDLSLRVRRLGFDHDTFEKDAIALLGGAALPELNALRHVRRQPPLDVDADGCDKLAEVLFGDETPEVRLLKTACEARDRLARLDPAIERTRAQVAELRHEVLRRAG